VGFGNSTCNRYSNTSTVVSSTVNGVRAWKSSIGRKTPSECAFHRPVSPEWMEFVRIANVTVSIFTFIVLGCMSAIEGAVGPYLTMSVTINMARFGVPIQEDGNDERS
ncbi:hypothetical protein T265_14021, partial [Opisthorchis viverrini]